MSFIKHQMFAVPLLHFKFPDWENVKAKLLLEIEKSKWQVTDNGMITDFHTERGKPPYFDEVCKLINPFKAIVEKEIKKSISPASVWYQTTSDGAGHDVHNHGMVGVSQVIYLDFDPEIHKPTRFVGPGCDPFTLFTSEYKPHMEEGDTVFFPSHVNHYQPGNFSSIPRTVIAINWAISGLNSIDDKK